MQTLLRRLAALGIALAALFSLFPCQTHAVSTSASSAILMDVDSGRVLYEQNADAKMLIASTTKILTALVAIREGDLNDVVTVSREAAYTEGSSMYLKVGEKLTLAQLSRQFFLSESAISAYITQTTGLSFFDLLGEMRIGKSISFLLYTDLTMEQLAEILGFVDSSHISKVFSARLGMKASQFREVYRRVGGLCGIQDDPTAYEVVSYLYHNYTRDLLPQHTAARFGLSVKELNTLLLYQVEKDFTDFLNFLRINRACTLLKTTDKSVTDIAFEVGYNTVKTFSRNFLKFRGMSPGAFRQEVALQENAL